MVILITDPYDIKMLSIVSPLQPDSTTSRRGADTHLLSEVLGMSYLRMNEQRADWK